MSDFNPYDFPMTPADELEYLRRFYRIICDCDTQNDLLSDRLSEEDWGRYAELDHLCEGLRRLYQEHPHLKEDPTP
jgi:hypothetical protein